MENVNIYAVLATWKKNKQGLSPIHINIDVNGKRAAFPSLKKHVKPEQWDSDKRQVKGHPNQVVLNALIRQRIAEYEGEITKKQLSHTRITKNTVKKQVKAGTGNNQDFLKFCREQIQVKDYSSETTRTYESEVSKIEQKYEAVYFPDIDYTWLQGYENYMRKDLLNHDNTVWKSFKFMNTMMNSAIKAGIIQRNPFDDYDRGNYKQGIPLYLEWHEAQAFHNALKTKPITEYLQLIGYYALLSYYSGLRFGDSVTFNYEKKVINAASGRRLLLYTSKTGEIVSIAFTKYITEIVDHIKDKPLKITNQEFNKSLKSLQAIAEIKKDISSHAFRHGFAMRCAELGMSIDEVQRLMGHTKRQTTEIYFKIKDKRLDDSMKRWEND